MPAGVSAWGTVTDFQRINNLGYCSQAGTVSWEGTNTSSSNFLSTFTIIG